LRAAFKLSCSSVAGHSNVSQQHIWNHSHQREHAFARSTTQARNIEGANWTFLRLAREIRATVFGLDEEKMVRRAIKEILARLKSEKFNFLEITRVTSVASKRFLEVCYVTVSAQSGLIQQGVGLVPAKDIVLRMPAVPNGEMAAKQMGL